MKKLFKGISLLVLVFVLVACGNSSSKIADGKYQAAAETADNGWTTYIVFDVKDGKMTNFKFDSVNLMSGDKETKAQQAAAGKYVMVKGSTTWDKQAKLVEDYVLDKQSLKDVKFNEEGKTDAISGATISFDEVADLIDTATKNGPVKKGTMSDGVYFAKDSKKDDKGFTYILGYLVNEGTIIAAHADAYKEEVVKGETTKTYKTVLAKEGKYDLGDKAVAPYNEQAKKVSDYIVANQNLDIKLDADGKTDAISGATIGVAKWHALFSQVK